MDDKTADELAFHQETVASDTNTPLHLIREKEIEISSRVLDAKRQADEIVADARKQAAARLAAVQEDASELSLRTEREVEAEVGARISELRERSAADVAGLETSIEQRLPSAVALVVDAVTSV